MKVLIAVIALATIASAQHQARVLSQTQNIEADGQYGYEYSADNGIQVQESGIGGQYANGRAAWISPEGEKVEFTYTADENGYQASGPWVPKTPEHVLRALEYIRSQPVYEDDYSRSAVKTYKAAPAFKPAAFKPAPAFKSAAFKPASTFNTFSRPVSTFQRKF